MAWKPAFGVVAAATGARECARKSPKRQMNDAMASMMCRSHVSKPCSPCSLDLGARDLLNETIKAMVRPSNVRYRRLYRLLYRLYRLLYRLSIQAIQVVYTGYTGYTGGCIITHMVAPRASIQAIQPGLWASHD